MLPAASTSLSRLKPALARLSACKNQVALTPFAVETWVAALSVYSTAAVNEAVVRIAMSEDPFPDLGKLVMRCEAIRRRDAGIVTQNDSKTLSDKSIKSIADAMGLKF
jgi:hypothetical protein